MNGLVSGYGSESDDEEASNNQVSKCKSSKELDWMECMDNTTGYKYYWNRVTNEVSWDRPSDLPPLPPPPSRPKPTTSSSRSASSSSSSSTKDSSKAKSKKAPLVFIGPTLPQLSPEEIARQKVVKFEESMAKEIVDEIVKESPADWKEKKPMKGLYNRPFAWKKTQGSLKTMREMEEKVKKAAQSISLIAGIYGDDDDSDSEEPSPEKDKDNRKKTGRSKQRQGIHVKVQKPASKQPKPLLKDVPAIFQNQDEDDDIESQDQPESNGKEDPPKKRRRWDMKENQTKSDRTYINSAAEILCDKLESLNVAAIPITPLKILAVQVETLFAAWQSDALALSYLVKELQKLTTQMTEIESNDLAPPGWRAIWDRSVKKYAYENLVTRERQFEKPVESDDDEIVEVKEDDKKVKPSPPPLPPPPPEEDSQPPPPLPPEVEPPPKQPEVNAEAAVHQVEDMDMSDEDESEAAGTIIESNSGNNGKLDDALNSFYSDLASFASSQETTPVPTPPLCESPGPSAPTVNPVQARDSVSPSVSDERSCSPFSTGTDEERQKKKKTKISTGLSMKKKNVGSLVAKWQNIQQQEAKRSD